jgi:type III secretory pathway component EscU
MRVRRSRLPDPLPNSRMLGHDVTMDGTSIVVALVVFLISIAVTYVVIRSAVLAALRMHRDEVRKEEAARKPHVN